METSIFEAVGLNQKLPRSRVVNGMSSSEIRSQSIHPGDAAYHPCPEAYPLDAVPPGETLRFPAWSGSSTFPDTERDIAVFVPSQVESRDGIANLIVFNDGHLYLDPSGSVRAASVLATLIHSGRIPPTIAIFANPGRPLHDQSPAAIDTQRSHEYDRLSEDFPRMLTRELLPFVEESCDLRLPTSPERVAICGISSGGIAAFNAAWHLPQRFGNVISHCGSFTNIEGGHNYPYLVRTTERKPIRVWMQSGENDANIPWGNWSLANRTMADALAFAGYEVEFAFGTGAHNLRHGGALFATALTWIWNS